MTWFDVRPHANLIKCTQSKPGIEETSILLFFVDRFIQTKHCHFRLLYTAYPFRDDIQKKMASDLFANISVFAGDQKASSLRLKKTEHSISPQRGGYPSSFDDWMIIDHARLVPRGGAYM